MSIGVLRSPNGVPSRNAFDPGRAEQSQKAIGQRWIAREPSTELGA
jgi:hypothetical protein